MTEAYGAIRRKHPPAEPALAKAGGWGRSDRLPASGGKAIRRRRTSAADDALMVDQGGDAESS